jgi:hypothetical protein
MFTAPDVVRYTADATDVPTLAPLSLQPIESSAAVAITAEAVFEPLILQDVLCPAIHTPRRSL